MFIETFPFIKYKTHSENEQKKIELGNKIFRHGKCAL